MSISAQIRIRRDTAANFTSANPTLALGEIAYETDTGNLKVGTGSTAWTALAYINPFRGNAAAPVSNTVLGGGATVGTSNAGGSLTASASNNTAIGMAALGQLQTGIENTAVGHAANQYGTAQGSNTAIGTNALRGDSAAPWGGANTAVGRYAGELGGNGATHTVLVGTEAGRRNRASDIIAIGSQTLDANTLGTANVAVGRSALGAATSAIGTFTTTPVAAGTGYTANQTGVTVTLVKKSGADTFTGTVQASLTTNASGAVTAVAATPVSAGSIFTGTNVIFEPSGFGAGSGCEISIATLATASSNTAVGHNAGLLQTTASSNTLVGAGAGDAITTGNNNSAVGSNALGSLTTAINCTAVGNLAAGSTTNGNANTAVGQFALNANTTGGENTVVGTQALLSTQTTSNTTAIGSQAGRYRGPGTDTLTSADNSIFIGHLSRANDNAQTNQVVIAGTGGLGDGSNTTVIGNTSTTSTRIPAGRFTVSSTEASTSTTTGALVVGGGVGVAGNVNVGGEITSGVTTTKFHSTGANNARLTTENILTVDVGGSLRVRNVGGTTEYFRVDSAGNATINNGNLVLGTAGNGISFAATSDPSIPAVAATGAIRGTATNVSDGDTVRIGDVAQTYTFKTTLTGANYEVLIGGNAADSLTNLRHAILGTGGTPGTDYQVPAAHPTVTAGAIAGSTIPLTAITAGTAGNSIALAETSAELSVSAATLLGGAAAAGMSGELLNDYETGTWSPRLESTGGTLVGVNQVSNANYTKIGQLVTVQAFMFFTYADISLASGQLRIAGLPYSVSGHAAAGIYAGQWTVSPAYLQANSGTSLYLNKRSSTSAQSGVQSSVPADLDTSTTASRNQMVITFTYRTA